MGSIGKKLWNTTLVGAATKDMFKDKDKTPAAPVKTAEEIDDERRLAEMIKARRERINKTGVSETSNVLMS